MSELTIHELMLLKINEVLEDPSWPHRDEKTKGVRADRLANSMDGVGGRAAADYVYAIRDLRDTGDIANDLNKLRFTEKGALRVRELQEMSNDVINRKDFERPLELYLGWKFEGAPGPPLEPPSYICYASGESGEERFQVVVHAPGFDLDRGEQYARAADVAIPFAKGLVFLEAWSDKQDYQLTLPLAVIDVPSPEIRDAIIRGLHRLYERDFKQNDVVVDYEAVALGLEVSENMVLRAVKHLMDVALVSDEPSTLGLNWKNGTLWLTARGVEYAEQLAANETSDSERDRGVALLDPQEPPADDSSAFIYDVAISFAGSERELAETLAKAVRDEGFNVFYDDFYKEQLWGQDLAVFFDRIYRRESRYCVMIISEEYADRMWPIHERQSAQARAIEEKGSEYILPIRVDDTELDGLRPTLGHLDVRQHPITEIAELLIEKLRKAS